MFQHAYQIRVQYLFMVPFFWGKLYIQRNTEIPSLDKCTHLCNLNPCQDIGHDHHLRNKSPLAPLQTYLSRHHGLIFCFPSGLAAKESTCNAGDLVSIPGLGRSPGEGKGYPLQYSGLENSMHCIIYGVTKSRTRLSDFHFDFSFCIMQS